MGVPAATEREFTMLSRTSREVIAATLPAVSGALGEITPNFYRRLFAAHPNQVLSRDRLLDLTSHRDLEPFDRSIDVRITRIRRKIEVDAARPQVIKTVRGTGYMFVNTAD